MPIEQMGPHEPEPTEINKTSEAPKLDEEALFDLKTEIDRDQKREHMAAFEVSFLSVMSDPEYAEAFKAYVYSLAVDTYGVDPKFIEARLNPQASTWTVENPSVGYQYARDINIYVKGEDVEYTPEIHKEIYAPEPVEAPAPLTEDEVLLAYFDVLTEILIEDNPEVQAGLTSYEDVLQICLGAVVEEARRHGDHQFEAVIGEYNETLGTDLHLPGVTPKATAEPEEEAPRPFGPPSVEQ